MDINALPLSFIETLTNLHYTGADQISKPLPKGKYSGLQLEFTGTGSASVDDADYGSVRVTKLDSRGGFSGDIYNINIAYLRKINNALLGLVHTTDGTTFAHNVVIPFNFGFPNALYSDGENYEVTIEKCNTALVTACSCRMLGLQANVPQSYLPIVAQRRFNSLGGINSEPIKLQNLMVLAMLDASTTNPTSVVIKSENRQAIFTMDDAKHYTDLAYKIESASLGMSIINLINSDISDALSDEVTIFFSGGSGYMDYITIASVFDNDTRVMTNNQVQQAIADKWKSHDLVAPGGQGFSTDTFKR
jgi:hypothetical protein